MEYVYAAMLIHRSGKKVDESSMKKVLEAAGVTVDEPRVKALVAALDGLNIEEAIQKAAVAPVAAGPVGGAPVAEAKKEEKKDDKKSEEAAAAGLGALFG